MKIFKSIIVIALVSLFVTACYIDKGNYKYTPISDIEITGMAETYAKVSAIDTLKINPTITSSYGDNLEYAWVLFDAKLKADTIGRAKQLNYFVEKPLGSYTLYLYVKSKENGYFVHKSAKVSIGTIYTKGHYILKETAAGNTDLDLLLDDGRVVRDILQTTQGAALNGKPRSLGLLYGKAYVNEETLTKTNSHSLGVITESNIAKIYRASDMKELFNRSNMFFDQVDDIPYKFLTTGGANIYYSSKGCYVSIAGTPGVGLYGFPLGVQGGSSKWIYTNSTEGMFVWDDAKGSILMSDYSGGLSLLEDENYPTTGLNYECVNIGANRGGMNYFLRDKSNSSKLVIYRINPGGWFSAPYVERVVQIAPTSKLHSATYISSNQYTAEYVYFVSDNTLYYYDVTSNKEYPITSVTIGSGDNITFVENRRYTLIQPYFDYFTIATYNNGNYKVQMYNMIGGLPTGAPVREVSGVGKVKETHYLGTKFDTMDEMMGYTYSR